MADPKVVTALTALFLTEECAHQSSLPLILLDMWVSDSSDEDGDPEKKRAPLRKYLQHQLEMCNSDEKTVDGHLVDNILKTLQSCVRIPAEDAETLTRLVKESFQLRKTRLELRKTVLKKYIGYLQVKPKPAQKREREEDTVKYSPAALQQEVAILESTEQQRAIRRQSHRPVKRPRKMDL